MAANKLMTVNTAGLPLYKGRVNKTALARQVVKELMLPNGNIDNKKALTNTLKLLNQYSKDECRGVTITIDDIARAVSEERFRMAHMQLAAPTPAPTPAQAFAHAPSYQEFEDALMKAKTFISYCDGDSNRAHALIDLVTRLMK